MIDFTGSGIVSCLGQDVASNMRALREGDSGVSVVEEWVQLDGLRSHVAGLVGDFDNRFIPRKTRRTMSKMSEMLCKACDEAMAEAGLSLEQLNSSRVMIIVGSTTGSAVSFEASFAKYHTSGSAEGQRSTTMFKTMNHSVALNLASYLGFKGAVLSPSSACSTGAQAILLGGQFIEAGVCDIAICGGGDECHVSTAIAFDTLHAASSSRNGTPKSASRPFDRTRDGVVVAEGAAVAILESKESRVSRGAESKGRLLGWSQSCDGGEVAHSTTGSMAGNMRNALEMAGLKPDDVGYINAHATSTLLGDQYEAEAVFDVFGAGTAISSLKGHMGHCFAPCGTIEAIVTLHMLKTGTFIPTLNLEEVAPGMPNLDYLKTGTVLDTRTAMSNNFAMGGMNVSVILGA